MKNILLQTFIIVLLISCTATTPIVQVNPTEILDTPVAVTNTPLPTQINTATPSQTLAPIVPVQIEPHPLALNEFNAGTEMKLLNTFGTGTPQDIKFSPDGSMLAIATGRGVYFYDGETFEEVSFIEINNGIDALAFNPNGNTIALATGGTASIWNISSGQKLKDLERGMISIYELAYGANGHIAAIGGDCASCGTPVLAMVLWDELTGKNIYEERGIWYSSNALQFTSDGKTLFFGGNSGLTSLIIESKEKTTYSKSIDDKETIDIPLDIIFDEISQNIYVTSRHYNEPNQVININGKSQKIFELCPEEYFSLIKSDKFGICNSREEIIVFDLATGKKIDSIFTNQKESVSKHLIAINLLGNKLVYSGNNSLNVIELPTKKEVISIPISDFNYSNSGIIELNGQLLNVVAVLSSPGQVEIFDIETGNLVKTLKSECCEIEDFAFAPDGKTGATIINDNILSIWDINLQKVIDEIVIDKGYLFRLMFSPEGSKIFVKNHEEEIFEVDLQTKSITKIGDGFVAGNSPFTANDFQFTKDNKIILFGVKNKTIYFTEIFQDEKLLMPFLVPYVLETFAIDNANQYLAVGMPNSILIWDLQNNKLLQKLDKHEKRYGDGWVGAINHLLFAPNSNLLASVGFDGTTRLWNAKAGTELRILNVCCSASFTPDGRYFVTAGDGVIRVWGIP